jgi:thiamine biosynthesis protein ThiI
MSSSRASILLRYHEIALKGYNRKWFEDRFTSNARKLLKRALGGDARIEFSRSHSRVFVHAPWSENTIQALSRLFGMSSFSVLKQVPTTHADLILAAIDEARLHIESHEMSRTFRVRTRRTVKALPETSIELDTLIGGEVKDAFPQMRVDLKDAELSIGIDLHKPNSYLWTRKIPGPGGLPVGSQCPVLALLSGGIDSPVAAMQILRRGSPLHFLHFHGTPFVGEEVLEKVEDLVRVMNRYQPDPRALHVIPFGKIQEKIALATNPKMRTLLYRRMMIRIASTLAHRYHLQAIVTGEALGQVASQTLENIASIDSVATLPIFRPLIGLDKDEIIAKAKKIGTFEISIRPGVDCCTLFADRHPAVRSSSELLEEEEKKFPMDEFIAEAIAGMARRPITE